MLAFHPQHEAMLSQWKTKDRLSELRPMLARRLRPGSGDLPGLALCRRLLAIYGSEFGGARGVVQHTPILHDAAPFKGPFMALLTPTKRVLTEEAHHALRAPISPSSSLISDDLAARLQNVGSRVRKCVNEGYATSRYGLTSSIPPTPFSSPTKVNAESPATSHTVFRTANETLAAVFSSPSGGKTQAPPHTPSPRKRGRRELETDAEEDQRLPVSSANEDTEMDTDAEDVTIITTPTPSPIRPLKPLRKSARPHAPARTPVWHGMTTTSEAMDAIEATNAGTSAVIKDWNDMFTQEF